MCERNFHWENLTVQLGQFAAFPDTIDISVTNFFESLVNFGKNKNQKMLLSEVTKKTDQLSMIEIAKEFVGDNQARLRTFGRF